jgi:hypothetical protein
MEAGSPRKDAGLSDVTPWGVFGDTIGITSVDTEESIFRYHQSMVSVVPTLPPITASLSGIDRGCWWPWSSSLR